VEISIRAEDTDEICAMSADLHIQTNPGTDTQADLLVKAEMMAERRLRLKSCSEVLELCDKATLINIVKGLYLAESGNEDLKQMIRKEQYENGDDFLTMSENRRLLNGYWLKVSSTNDLLRLKIKDKQWNLVDSDTGASIDWDPKRGLLISNGWFADPGGLLLQHPQLTWKKEEGTGTGNNIDEGGQCFWIRETLFEKLNGNWLKMSHKRASILRPQMKLNIDWGLWNFTHADGELVGELVGWDPVRHLLVTNGWFADPCGLSLPYPQLTWNKEGKKNEPIIWIKAVLFEEMNGSWLKMSQKMAASLQLQPQIELEIENCEWYFTHEDGDVICASIDWDPVRGMFETQGWFAHPHELPLQLTWERIVSSSQNGGEVNERIIWIKKK